MEGPVPSPSLQDIQLSRWSPRFMTAVALITNFHVIDQGLNYEIYGVEEMGRGDFICSTSVLDF
jgi:hypothetical protein